MRKSKTNIKTTIKRLGKKALIKEYRVGIVNDEIVVSVDMSVGRAENIRIGGKKYEARNNTVKLPYTGEMMAEIIANRITADLVIGSRERTAAIARSFMVVEDEKIVIDKRSYGYDRDALIKLSDISIGDTGLSFSYKTVAGQPDKLIFVVMDKEFKTKAVSPELSGEAGSVTLGDVRTIGREERLQLFALTEKKAIPAVVGIGRKPGGVTVRQLSSRVYLEGDGSGSYTFKADRRLTVKPFTSKSKTVEFDIEFENDEVFLTVDLKKAAGVVLLWHDLRTGNENEIATITSPGHSVVALKPQLERKLVPFERYALRYRIMQKEKIAESGFVYADLPKKRLYSDNVVLSHNGNRIMRMANRSLVLEKADSILSYPEKYAYDFSASGFKALARNIRLEGNELCFDLSLQSTLLRISSVSVYVNDNYRKESRFLEEVVFDTPEMKKELPVRIDMEQLSDFSYNNSRLALWAGVRYVNGYGEDDFICAAPREYAARERFLFDYAEDGMSTELYLGENHFNLKLWHTSEEELRKGINYQEGREAYFKTIKSEDIDNHLILFETNLGKNYTGNPKYLYEYMISRPEYSKFKYVWVYPDKENCPIPGDPVIVERGTAEYFHYLAKAKYRINNIRFPLIHKREGSVYLNTWHGTPLKKLGFDIECEGPEKHAFAALYQESLNWDYMTVDNDYGEEKLTGAFRFEGKVIKKGYPINDIYFDEDRKKRVCERIERDYPVTKEKKVILYAPTWRDLKGDYVRGYEFSLPFDIRKLYEAFGDEYVIIVKLHHLIANNLVIDEKYKDFLINASDEEDIMELLCKTDILITDYSSVFYDFASARKPMLFYMYDLEEYLNETRGTYIDVNDLPGEIIKDDEGLIRNIQSIRDGNYRYTAQLRAFCNEFAKYCKGTSSRDVLEAVIDKEDLK